MRIWPFVTLLLLFALLFTTRIALPLKRGQRISWIEQKRPEIPPPLFESRQERMRDEARFSAVIEQLSEKSGRPSTEIRELLLSTLRAMQSEIPFTFSSDYYNVLCLPEPTLSYEVHQRLHIGDSTLGVPIYLDVRLYDAPKEAVLHALFSTLDGAFEEQACEAGEAFIGRGERLFVGDDPTHGFAKAQGERTLFFHLIEKGGRVYVAYAEAPSRSFPQITYRLKSTDRRE